MNYMLLVVILYFIIMNIFSFILFFADKRKAIARKWRVPESTLLASAFAGGSLGALLAMKTFRHKTKHLKFTLSVPLMLVLHIILFSFLFAKLK